MTEKNIPVLDNFLGVKKAKFENAHFILLPVPYEGTVTYGSGTQHAPRAIIEASKHVEFYDDELNFEPYIFGIHTLPDVICDFESPEEMFNHINSISIDLAKSGKFIIMLGGEHSITPGMVSALTAVYDEISVLQLDAHADLRDSYAGSRYNHACAIRRVLEYCPAVQVGIRSLSRSEKSFIDSMNLPVFFMRDMKNTDWIDNALGHLTKNVYITIDLDAFDPSIMPSVGTPEPNGMLWDNVTELFCRLSRRHKIIGFDVVELSPQNGYIAPDFLSAKLIYKLMGYALYDKVKSQMNDKGKATKMINDTDKIEGITYIMQVTDTALELSATVKIDPEKGITFRDALNIYVKNIDESIMTTESIRKMSIIQDSMYTIDDNGELADLYEGIIIKHGDDLVDIDDEITFKPVYTETHGEIMLLDINIDRLKITEEGNPYGYNIRSWNKNKDIFEEFVYKCLADKYGNEAKTIIELSAHEDKIKFLMAISRKIWESDFELYSRFIGDKSRFKDGSETLKNIINGRGGTCTEKSSAMKLITDVYGFESEYLLSGPNAKGPFPIEPLRKLLETMDFSFGKKYMIYWQHSALLYKVDDEDVMIDVTNGNVPYLFLRGYGIEEFLRPNHKKSFKVKMVFDKEDFYYHVVPQDIPENLLVAMQDWIEDIDLINVFDDGLGLLINKDYYVWPLMYHDDDDKLSEYDWWLEKKLPAVELLDNFSLPGPIVNKFKEKYPQKFVDIVEASDYLAERYNESYRESIDEPIYNVAYIFVKLT